MAMIAVLVILLAIFALSAPFLMSVRNADRASAELTDRARARLALDSALRHARAQLGDSHPGVDTTPYFDSEEEFDVGNRFPEGIYDASDPRGAMWGLEVEDLAGLIDLNSASHHVLANLMGGVARNLEAIEKSDRSIEVSSASGFAPSGFFYLREELVSYGAFEDLKLSQLSRGLLYEEPEAGEPAPCGPGKPSGHPLGSYLIDQRSLALPLWRMFHLQGLELGSLDSLQQATESRSFAMIGDLPPGFLETLQRTASVQGHVGAGSRWQNPTRLLRQLEGEERASCRFLVEDTRFINAGCTVRFSDGDRVEYAIVRSVDERQVELMDALEAAYDPRRTTISVLARRPVNINTASPEVLQALMENLKLVNVRARITSGEATELVKLVTASRPFTSFEDFVRRVVLPAGGFKSLPADAPLVPEVLAKLQNAGQLGADGQRSVVGFIDEDDARALYKNARNANDRELAFSTMPFSFTSRDLYRLEMRASVNARSGVERAHRVREQVDLVVPQKPLLKFWHRQEDFDEEGRLDRAAPGWVSGPEPTARSAGRFPSRNPSRSLAHLGNFDSAALTQAAKDQGTPVVQTFASREGSAWLQLAPARVPDPPNSQGRALHFDFETESLEGHYLPDGILTFPAGASPVQFTGNTQNSSSTTNVVLPNSSASAIPVGGNAADMRAVNFEMWIKPQELVPGANFLSAGGAFSLGGPFGLSDMVELTLDQEDLVLRLRDGLPDHLATPGFEELAEVRYSLSEGPGLPLDVWTHVSVGLAGTRPDQMRLVVDGRMSSDATGLTRLTSGLGPNGTSIAVESTENFPDKCVLLIGEELIEALKTGPNSFSATFEFSGENAGFGGRLARETYSGANPELNQGLSSKQTNYPEGTSVQLYGYSLPLSSEVSELRGSLTDQLGLFAVARAVGVRQGNDEYVHVPATGRGVEDRRPEILVSLAGGLLELPVGYGLPGGDPVDEILIEPADINVPRSEMLQAFSRAGGYAVLISNTRSFSNALGGGAVSEDIGGFDFGGIEVIRYSGVSDKGIILDARGDGVPELNLDPLTARRKSFIFQLNEDLNETDFPIDNESLFQSTFVVPISIPVSGMVPPPQGAVGGGASGLADPSELIQLTHTGNDAHLTEWVRYDRVARGSVVRADRFTLERVRSVLLGGSVGFTPSLDDDPLTPPDPDPRLPAGSLPEPRASRPEPPQAAPAAVPAAQQQPQSGAYWHYAMGQSERTNVVTPVAHAVASALQFRGVMGTFPHVHPGGTLVLPVFRLPSGDVQRGMPGRFDAVTLFEQLGQGPGRGVPGVVHRAHRALEYLTYSFMESGVLVAAAAGSPASSFQDPEFLGQTLVALDDFTARIANSNQLQPGSATASFTADTRSLARMSKFPAGELPRAMESVSLGGSYSGQGSVPSAEIDEVVFGNDRLDHQFILDTDIGQSATNFVVRGRRYPGGDEVLTNGMLQQVPAGAGLLRMGDEVMAYADLDPAGNTITIPDGGRGLLGTDAQAHAAGEGFAILESYTVGILQAALDAEEPYLSLDSGSAAPGGFPTDGGLVLVDRELIHFTRYENGQLEMPRASEEPGRNDLRGAGLFRGRFGTDPESHPAGTPVILFPFRYWDRWSPKADAPELDFFEFSMDQPGAFLGKLFWELEEGPAGGVRLGILQRLGRTTPWDADPNDVEALEVYYRGNLERGGNPIGAQADSAQWRAFVEYERGAFDALDGQSHGWKTTPRLRRFGVEYVAPGLALQRIER